MKFLIRALITFSVSGWIATPGDHSSGSRYSLSDGFDLLASITLHADGTFEFSWDGCTGPIARATGRYRMDGDEVSLRPASGDFRKDVRTFSDAMLRVRWGTRDYLIPKERMLAFANAVNGGFEPRPQEMGLFYLLVGDSSIPATGRPELPLEWQAFLLDKPVTGRLLKVEQRETPTQRPLVVVDRGSAAGLRVGMKLYATNPKRPHFRGYLTILEVADASARAVVTFQYNHVRKGDSWSTRATGDGGLREVRVRPTTRFSGLAALAAEL